MWLSSLVAFSHGAIIQYEHSSDIALASVVVGLVSFLLVWLIALLKIQKKPRINAVRLPLLTIATTLVWLISLVQFASANGRIPQPPVPEKKEVIQSSPTSTAKPELKETTATNKNTITCTGPDGKKFQTTQKECEDFNLAWGNTAIMSGDCKDPSGKVIEDEKCPWLTQGNNPQPQRVENTNLQKQPPCTVGGTTYYYTDPETCSKWQTEQKKYEDSLENFQFTPPTSTYTYTQQQDTSAFLEQCKNEAYSKYRASEQQVMVLYGGASSAGPAMIQIAKNTLDSDLAACEYAY